MKKFITFDIRTLTCVALVIIACLTLRVKAEPECNNGEDYVLLKSQSRCPKNIGVSLFRTPNNDPKSLDVCAGICEDYPNCDYFTYGSVVGDKRYGSCIGCDAGAAGKFTDIAVFDLYKLCRSTTTEGLELGLGLETTPITSDDSEADAAIPCIPVSMDLAFSTSTLVENNLGGLGPLDDDASNAIRYRGVGTVDGESIDLSITVKDGETYERKGGNGFSCAGDTTSAGDCASGHFGSINMLSGESTTLNFSFIGTESGELVNVPEFYFSVFDIDQSNSVYERYGITGFDSATYDIDNKEAKFTLGEGSDFCISQPASNGNCLYAESTNIGKGCDNPIRPDEIGEFNCLNNQGDSSLRSFLVYYKNTNKFEVHWENPCRVQKNCGKNGRNFLFAFRSGLAPVCETLPPVAPVCVPDECGVCDGPGKYTCCDGTETCEPETTCPPSQPISVCIALDESGSVCHEDEEGCPNWNVHIKGFAKNLIQGLDGVANSEFAIVTFAQFSEIDQDLSIASDAMNTIDVLEYRDGWTNTQEAIDQCRMELEKASTDRLKYMILVTDGLPTNNKANEPNQICSSCKDEARVEAKDAKDADISIISVGVNTASFNETILRELASPGMYFSVTGGFDELYKEIEKVNQAANRCISEETCVPDECDVCNGPGKYLCCDGSQSCDPEDCPRSMPVSVCIALDESGSVCKDDGPDCPNWNVHTKGFAKKLIQGIDGVSDAQFAVVSFARKITLDQGLSDAESAIQTINALEYRDGWTNTQGAIEACRKELENAPDDHLTYLVLVTDGFPTVDKDNNVGHNCNSCIYQAEDEANIAKEDAGIKIISVGVRTSLYNPAVLETLASGDPSNGEPKLFFDVTDFDELDNTIEDVNRVTNICQNDAASA